MLNTTSTWKAEVMPTANEQDATRIDANKQVLVSLAKLESVRVLTPNEEMPACATALVAKI